MIVDNAGQPIWENPLAGKVTTNFQVQSYRGSPVLTWWEGSIELGHGVGEYVIADASYRTVRRVQAAHGLRGDLHEFVITPRDTALLTSYVVRKADLSAVGGSRKGTIQDAIFQEIDLATGGLLLEWHSLDHVPLQESYAPVGADWDFFHINSVDLDGDGNLLVSSRSMQTVYKIDRTGRILWRLGGKHSDFEMGAGASFAWQHDARRQPDGTLTVFDNGATPAVEKRSRGLILDARRAGDDRDAAGPVHPPEDPRRQPGQRAAAGERQRVRRLGRNPRVSEFDRSGRWCSTRCSARSTSPTAPSACPGRACPPKPRRSPWPATASELTAYASWNGATEVERWQLLAGAQAGALQPVASTRSRGFESALRATVAPGQYFAVQALGAGGAPLGQSRTVTV